MHCLPETQGQLGFVKPVLEEACHTLGSCWEEAEGFQSGQPGAQTYSQGG